METRPFYYNPGYSQVSADVQNRVINQVFVWMALGLALTAGTAFATASSEAMMQLVFGNPIVFFGLIIAEFGLVVGVSAAINRLSLAAATGLFFLYSALNGVTLASIFMVYSLGSIGGVFLVTAGTFGAMSLYGLTTKRDLTKIGSLAFMALIGIIIAGVVNMFLHSSVLSLIVSLIGLVVFIGLTAYDTQKIKEMAAMTNDGESEGKVAVLGALSLYLDFINLFLILLRLFGGGKDE
ncbi:protein of unknown function UPF0005 [Chloroherpeton thalassium ATCC 35110]|uniref:Inner membrane protein YbhL n=1 Tax=Chloroherpeton thalassium (strain ATCC 35110 / GB-78) TaxID=517418 RepID=B3QT11_CHLT3|nr:Bax inhibitor-1/YccA family protein [Chloroherpeton thalassium]ACF12654.1 protein of unknown function UPF0005 [Chloroherpeton thalassium ATCC 35110]